MCLCTEPGTYEQGVNESNKIMWRKCLIYLNIYVLIQFLSICIANNGLFCIIITTSFREKFKCSKARWKISCVVCLVQKQRFCIQNDTFIYVYLFRCSDFYKHIQKVLAKRSKHWHTISRWYCTHWKNMVNIAVKPIWLKVYAPTLRHSKDVLMIYVLSTVALDILLCSLKQFLNYLTNICSKKLPTACQMYMCVWIVVVFDK